MSNLIDQASLVMIPSGYKEDKIYSQVPTDGSGDLTFTRASDGTRVNSQGLVERVPWNLASDSNSFPFLSGITKTTGQNDPFGGANGNLLTATGAGEHYAEPTSLTAVVGNTYTFSVYGKFVQGVNLALRTVFSNGSADISTIWNLNTGELVSNATDHTNPTITSVGNGWYRCSITYTPSSVPAFPLLFRLQMAVGTSLSFTATSGDGFLAYGAQINEGTLKPYFPTTDRLNVPRLDYSNGCPSLFLEPQRTNLITYSEDITNSFATKFQVTITSNNTTSPDGTQNADLLKFDSSTAYILRNQTVNALTAYTMSVFVKNNNFTSGQILTFNMSDGVIGGLTAQINVVAKTATFSGASGAFTSVSGKVEDYGNGWFRVSVTGTSVGGGSGWYEMAAAGVTNSCFVWGFSLEEGSYPTSYIPTTSASVTRVADAAYKTGISSLIGQTEGSVFFDFTVDTISSQINDPVLWYMKDGGAGERYIELYSNGNLVYVEYTTLTISSIIKSGLTVGRHKCAIAYATDDFVFYVDGVQVGTDTSGTPNAYSTFGLQYYNSVYLGQQQVNQCAIFKTRLTNAELAALTTL